MAKGLKSVKKYLKSPQWLRNLKTKKRSFWKIFGNKQPQIIENGGWHFSFLKKPEDIKKKRSLILTKNLILRILQTLIILKKKF